MHRYDALEGKGDERLLALTGDTLDSAPDPELQRIVVEVAERFGAPVALVSLVLKRTQFFRAHQGLPADLAVAQATDRDVSLCQFVVRDEAPLVVEDTSRHPALPSLLGEQYGIRSYLGSPLRIGGVVVGSLCTLDTKPRTFADADIAAIEQYAERASKRLTELAAGRRADAYGDALYPAFQEIRNLLTPIVLGLASAEVATAELGSVHRVASDILRREQADRQILKVLTHGDLMLEDLEGGVRDVGDAFARLRRVIEALEAAMLRGETTTSVDEILRTATTLAHHLTKLVGGVRLIASAPDASVTARRGPAAMFLSTVLTAAVRDVALGKAAQPQITPVEADNEVQFWITSDASSEETARALCEQLLAELPQIEGVTLRHIGPSLIVAMSAA